MTFSVRLVVAGLDVTSIARTDAPIVVRHGRAAVNEQPDPNSCVFTLDNAPRAPEVGEPVYVNVTAGTGPATRYFTGHLTDVTATMDATATRYACIAVSDGLGRAARRYIGDEPWGLELDGARVGRILSLCPDITIGTIDPGTVYITPRDVDRREALELLANTAGQAIGVMVDERNGSVSYHDANHRDPAAGPVLTLNAAELRTRPDVAMRVGTVVNRAKVRYGSAGGEIVREDTASIDRFGVFEVSVSTELADSASATAVATRVIDLYADPHWGTEIITVPVHDLPDPRAAAVAAVKPGDLLQVLGMPEPAPPQWLTWCEGMKDTFTATEWDRELYVSDRWSAPQTPPTDPTEPVACADFDFPALCSSANLFPNGGPITLEGPDPVGNPEVWSWEPDGTSVLTVPAGYSSYAFGGIGTLRTARIGTIGPHPHPWLSAADPQDFCVGLDNYSAGWDGAEPVAEFREVGGAVWYPASLALLSSLFAWVPDGGWAETDARWADGAPPPFDETYGAGCRVARDEEYIYQYPGQTRRPTRDGAWETLPTYFLFSADPDAHPLPLIAEFRLLRTFTKRARQRWARAAL